MGRKTEDDKTTITNINNGGTVGFQAGTITGGTITVTTNGETEPGATPTRNAPAPRGR